MPEVIEFTGDAPSPDKFERTAAKTALGCGCIGWSLLFNIALWGAIIYTAIHFIRKFW